MHKLVQWDQHAFRSLMMMKVQIKHHLIVHGRRQQPKSGDARSTFVFIITH